MKLTLYKLFTLASSIIISTLLTFCLAGQAHANYLLDENASSLYFLSTKNINITETHTFDSISGTLSASGHLQIDIDLSSVNTLIPIRNERMQNMLFNVSEHATATYTANVDKALLTLPVGTAKRVTVEGDLTISGISQKVSFEVLIVRLNNGNISATTLKPTVLNAAQFDLGTGIEALREIAKLAQISSTIPLTFSIEFTKQ